MTATNKDDTCQSCRFARPASGNPGLAFVECHRRAPAIDGSLVRLWHEIDDGYQDKNPVVALSNSIIDAHAWPILGSEDWCGEYEYEAKS